MSFTTDSIRNIALAGHGGTGKTTLMEHILSTGGAIPRPETIATGKTVSDYTDEEIDRKASIHMTTGNVTWRGTGINVMDTPGASDFVGEVVSAFRTAETAVMLVGAREGVQIETVKLWRRLNDRDKPRLVFVNKLDAERADFGQALADMREKFTKTFVPVVIPIVGTGGFSGVVDLVENKAYMIPAAGGKETAVEIPAEMADTVEEYRMALIEAAAEGDDALMEKYFEEETLSEEEIRTGLTAGVKSAKLVPVLCGAAELGCGVTSLLNFVVASAPNPTATVETLVGDEDSDTALPVSPEGSASAFIFKTSIDQFSGKLSYVKIITGSIKSDTELVNPRSSTKQRTGKIYRAIGKTLVDTDVLNAGDIGVLAKLDDVATGDTLCSNDNQITFVPLALPQPVHTVAIGAEAKKDEDKLNQFLQRAAEEDLTFQIRYDPETKQTVISGMGELHINMILDRIREKQKIEMVTKVPRVPYRETITKPAEAEYTHKKQTGGHGQYGRVVLQVRPLERGAKYQFDNAIKGGSISRGYIPGVEKGIQEGMESGILAGYPVVDLGATVIDGKEHPVDSSEMAFRLAAKGALMSAMERCSPVLLEPVVNLRVFTNEEHVGDILSDLSSRRGRVLGQEALGGGITEIDAQVPQAELLRYSIDLRSITSGTASFEMEFSHYNPISGKIAEDVISASKAAENE